MSTKRKIMKCLRQHLIERVAQTHANAIDAEVDGQTEMAKTLTERAKKLSAELNMLDVALGNATAEPAPAKPVQPKDLQPLFTALEQLFMLDNRHIKTCESAIERTMAGEYQAAWKLIAGVQWNAAATKLAGEVLGVLKAAQRA